MNKVKMSGNITKEGDRRRVIERSTIIFSIRYDGENEKEMSHRLEKIYRQWLVKIDQGDDYEREKQ